MRGRHAKTPGELQLQAVLSPFDIDGEQWRRHPCRGSVAARHRQHLCDGWDLSTRPVLGVRRCRPNEMVASQQKAEFIAPARPQRLGRTNLHKHTAASRTSTSALAATNNTHHHHAHQHTHYTTPSLLGCSDLRHRGA